MTICLTMIVRDESQVIERCIESVLPFIDSWAIVDTGSTDGCQDVIRRKLRDLPGTLSQSVSWGDGRRFGESRTEAIRLGEGQADYLLMMDADHVMHVEQPLEDLTADAYYIEHRDGNLHWPLPILMASRCGWSYDMPVHEGAHSKVPTNIVAHHDLWIEVLHDGARSRDPDKFAKDAAALKSWLDDKPAHPRGHYYYAQSLRDAGLLNEARDAYLYRSTLHGFDEETWSALYEVAKLTERLESPQSEVVQAYLTAYKARPRRAEPLSALARYHRMHGDLALSYLYARQAAEMEQPEDLLFIEYDCYDWKALDELAVAAYYMGHRDIGRAAAVELLKRPLPANERARAQSNLAFYDAARH